MVNPTRPSTLAVAWALRSGTETCDRAIVSPSAEPTSPAPIAARYEATAVSNLRFGPLRIVTASSTASETSPRMYSVAEKPTTAAGSSAERPMAIPAAPTAMHHRWNDTRESGGAGAADHVTVSINDTALMARTAPPARNRCNASHRSSPVTAATPAATAPAEMKATASRSVARVCAWERVTLSAASGLARGVMSASCDAGSSGVGDGHLLDAVEPARAQTTLGAGRCEVGDVVGDGVEHQVDLELRQV